MNWLEKHRKKIEDMKMPETVVTVSPTSICIHPYMFRGNKDVKEIIKFIATNVIQFASSKFNVNRY